MAAALVPAAPSAPSIRVLHHAGEMRSEREHDRGRVLVGVVWNACAPISMPM